MTPVEEDKGGRFLVYTKEKKALRKERDGLMSHKIGRIKF
jgi:hypothetical protein